MFNLTLVTKTEKQLWLATVEDQKKQIASLEEKLRHERARAEGAINALLIKTQNVALVPEPMSDEQANKMLDNFYDIFGDDAENRDKQIKIEQDIAERIQS